MSYVLYRVIVMEMGRLSNDAIPSASTGQILIASLAALQILANLYLPVM